MENKKEKHTVIWITLDSFNGERTLKQHALVPYHRKDGTVRNISLCGKIIAGNEDGKSAEFDTIIERDESLNKEKACKQCLKIYKKKFNITK